MPPQQDPQDATPKVPTPKDPFDLGSILLPKKETPGQTPQSAQRVNAGALLEQEQSATLKEPTPPDATPAPAQAPITPEPAKPEESSVKPLQTYRGDIESVVQDKNISVLSIATAEAERRGSQPIEGSSPAAPTPGRGSFVKTAGLYTLGLLLIAGASGALAYIIERPTSVATPQAVATPFIAVDETKEITISPATTRASLMASLSAAKDASALALGLISRLLVTTASSTASGQLDAVDAQTFFALVAPNIPPALLRTVRPTYLLGVHIYSNNAPFLIMSVDSYEQAYAGMIAWEPYMKQDLAPLFNTPAPIHIPEQGIASSTPNPDSQFIQTGFIDSIVENHDARVIQNNTRDISLLWTFLDRNTLVIATNPTTVREIISRIKEAPVTTVQTQ